MIFFFTHKRAFNRRINPDRRASAGRYSQHTHGFIGDRRYFDRRSRADRRMFNKGFPYRRTFISRLFD